jgi:hypothetical protein
VVLRVVARRGDDVRGERAPVVDVQDDVAPEQVLLLLAGGSLGISFTSYREVPGPAFSALTTWPM